MFWEDGDIIWPTKAGMCFLQLFVVASLYFLILYSPVLVL